MQEERYGTRDRTYSAWHRRKSTRRFVGMERAQTLAMIDLDASLYVEYDDGAKEPLALIETARDIGQSYKTATVTRKLALRAKLPAFILLYTLADMPNPADPQWKDIRSFRARMIVPREEQWKEFTPDEWCRYLVSLREITVKRVDKEMDEELKEWLSQYDSVKS